jgi:outer membrane protein W
VYPVRDYIGSLSAVFHSPVTFKGFRPYAAGGVDYIRFDPTPAAVAYAKNVGFAAVTTATINENSKLGINVGAGVEHKITKRLRLRIDVRDHVTSSPAFGLPPEPNESNAVGFPVKGRAHNLEYTAGVVYHVGKL